MTIEKLLDRKPFKIQDNIEFDYVGTLKRINSYINNVYINADKNSIFWNISNSRIIHFAKHIDLDTKDLQPYADGDVSYFRCWVLRMKFYRWLEDNHFALTLNARSIGLATYGSWVWKLTKSDKGIDISSPNLQNLYFDTSQENLKDGDIVEKHFLNVNQLRKKRKVWDNVDKVLKDVKDIHEIYEFWGYDEEEEEYIQKIQYKTGKDAIILLKENRTEDDFPYYDYHIGEYQGRWLRIGIVERCFDLQVRANQLVNQNVQASEIASLLLLRTSNPEMLGNVLQDVENGEVINSDDLQQIGISNNGLNQFVQELNLIEQKADEICLTPQLVTGDTLPSGTPFRSIAVATNAASSSYNIIRENLGEGTGYLLKEKIFPGIIKSWNGKEEILELSRDEADVRYFDKILKKKGRMKMLTDNIFSGKVVNTKQMEEVDKLLEENDIPKRVKIDKGTFDFKWHIRTNITGESVDKSQRNDALSNSLQWIQSNPAIVDIPYFRQYCEENGINWWRLTAEQQENIQQGQTSGAIPNKMGPKEDKLLSKVDTPK